MGPVWPHEEKTEAQLKQPILTAAVLSPHSFMYEQWHGLSHW